MKTFDTDVFTDILAGRRGYPQRVQLIPVSDQSIPIVVAEEMLRGELNMIRRCEQNPKADLAKAYDYLEESVSNIRSTTILRYTNSAHALVLAWKAAKLRVGTRDMRIAAVANVYGATLVTRNRRDFDLLSGLSLEIWP